MDRRSPNWPIWCGILTCIFALLSYPFFFVRFPVTRDFPWATLLLFAFALVLLASGTRRTFDSRASRKNKVVAVSMTILGVALTGLFVLAFFVAGRQLPASHGSPKLGKKAPDFRLSGTQGQTVTLSDLLTSPLDGRPPKGVLLVFYRGYW